MAKVSAGVLVHRRSDDGDRLVLLVHPGGPFWARRDDGAWSIPKGECDAGVTIAECEATARREFAEELGQPLPAGDLLELGEVRQKGGKRVVAFAVEAHVDVSAIVSNTFEMEWPPKSGRMQQFPEVDRAAWFTVDEARVKLIPAQAEFLDRLAVPGP